MVKCNLELHGSEVAAGGKNADPDPDSGGGEERGDKR